MPFKVGINPVIRTLKYLKAGRVYLNDKIKVFSVYLNTSDERHKGLR